MFILQYLKENFSKNKAASGSLDQNTVAFNLKPLQMFIHIANKILFHYLKGIIEHNKWGYNSETCIQK